MSESAHSPEPWHLEVFPEEPSEGFIFPADPRMAVTQADIGDAGRIVACVNACAGIPTDALEEGAIGDAVDTLLVILAAQPHWDGVRKVLRKMGRVP